MSIHCLDILGNAYLSLFFSGAQSPSMLKQCLAAYARAVSSSNDDNVINTQIISTKFAYFFFPGNGLSFCQ